MKNSLLVFNIIITIDMENIAPSKSDCALLIPGFVHLILSTNDE